MNTTTSTLRERAAEQAAREKKEYEERAAERLQIAREVARDRLIDLVKARIGVIVAEPSSVWFDIRDASDRPRPYIEIEGILFTRHERRGDYYDEMLLLAWRCPTCQETLANYRDDVRNLETLHHALEMIDELEADPSKCPACLSAKKAAEEEAAPPAILSTPRKKTTEERLAEAIGEIVDAHIDAHVSAYHAEEA